MSLYAYEHLHLHQLEWGILDSVLVGVERHYGYEEFFVGELVFAVLLCLSVWWLRKRVPLPVTDEEE